MEGQRSTISKHRCGTALIDNHIRSTVNIANHRCGARSTKAQHWPNMGHSFLLNTLSPPWAEHKMRWAHIYRWLVSAQLRLGLGLRLGLRLKLGLRLSSLWKTRPSLFDQVLGEFSLHAPRPSPTPPHTVHTTGYHNISHVIHIQISLRPVCRPLKNNRNYLSTVTTYQQLVSIVLQ